MYYVESVKSLQRVVRAYFPPLVHVELLERVLFPLYMCYVESVKSLLRVRVFSSPPPTPVHVLCESVKSLYRVRLRIRACDVVHVLRTATTENTFAFLRMCAPGTRAPAAFPRPFAASHPPPQTFSNVSALVYLLQKAKYI